jgi:hypothetical protein
MSPCGNRPGVALIARNAEMDESKGGRHTVSFDSSIEQLIFEVKIFVAISTQTWGNFYNRVHSGTSMKSMLATGAGDIRQLPQHGIALNVRERGSSDFRNRLHVSSYSGSENTSDDVVNLQLRTTWSLVWSTVAATMGLYSHSISLLSRPPIVEGAGG